MKLTGFYVIKKTKPLKNERLCTPNRAVFRTISKGYGIDLAGRFDH